MRYRFHSRRLFLFIFTFCFLILLLHLTYRIKRSVSRKYLFDNLIHQEDLNVSKSNEKLIELVTRLRNHHYSYGNKPSINHEVNRHNLRNNLDIFWFNIKLKLQKATEISFLNPKNELTELITSGSQLHSLMLATIDNMGEDDGHQTWRKKEAFKLSSLIQKRLYDIQNPKFCSSTKKLVCNLNIDCGFGCQIHHVVYCLIVAYGTRRMLLLDSQNWNYGEGAFEKMFEPLSETCQLPRKYAFKQNSRNKESLNNAISWWPGDKSEEYIRLPRMRDMKEKPPFLPPAIPKEFADAITSFHGDPLVWWIGQFLKFILRPTKSTKAFLNRKRNSYTESQHQVGIHIRRTDKLEKEANFYPIETYIESAKKYFEYMDLKNRNNTKRKVVYIASDDPEVFDECRTKYPEYTFLGDASTARSAATDSRYNFNSLQKLFTDVYMLSLSEFIVCTFSSNLCRVAYEIQQQRASGDSYWRFKSLDDMWQFNVKWDTKVNHHQEVILPHFANNPQEIDLSIGDVINIETNLWNGYAKGRNLRTQKTGYYPLYKVKEKLKVVDFSSRNDLNT